MESFLLEIININKSIDKVYKKSINSKRITNIASPSVRTKQYLIYYMYRIICKNRKTLRKIDELQQDIKNLYKK
jgi:hypothetical protein